MYYVFLSFVSKFSNNLLRELKKHAYEGYVFMKQLKSFYLTTQFSKGTDLDTPPLYTSTPPFYTHTPLTLIHITCFIVTLTLITTLYNSKSYFSLFQKIFYETSLSIAKIYFFIASIQNNQKFQFIDNQHSTFNIQHSLFDLIRCKKQSFSKKTHQKVYLLINIVFH